MKPAKKFIHDCFKNFVRMKVAALKDRDDFEVKFCKAVLPCTECEEGNSDSYYYRIQGEKGWIQVNEPGKCDKCRNQEAFNQYQSESMAKRKQLISERLTREYCLLPESLKNKASIKTYNEINKVTARAKRDVIKFIKDLLDPKGEKYNLFIMGSPGAGKTHLCVAIARYALKEGFTVVFLTSGQLISLIKATFNKASEKTEKDIINDIKSADLVILDDLGSEATGGNDDWRKTTLFEVVESRSGKPTIYTSNLTDLDLPAAVGNRVYSRLYENTKIIDLFTDDYRKKLQIK